MEPGIFGAIEENGEWIIVYVSAWGSVYIASARSKGFATRIATLLGMAARVSPEAIESGLFEVAQKELS